MNQQIASVGFNEDIVKIVSSLGEALRDVCVFFAFGFQKREEMKVDESRCF